MTDDRINQRAAELLPEELAAGSADPKAQAEAILADSDDREFTPEPLEERRSADAAASGDEGAADDPAVTAEAAVSGDATR